MIRMFMRKNNMWCLSKFSYAQTFNQIPTIIKCWTKDKWIIQNFNFIKFNYKANDLKKIRLGLLFI